MRFFLFIVSSFIFVGCSQVEKVKTNFENWQTKMAERKTFQIRKAWVKQAPQKTNLQFRKINRMSPLLYVDAKNGEMLIVANALDGISAYTRYQGHEVWRTNIPNGVEGNASLIKNRLFFGASDGNFYSLDASTGQIIWTFPTRIENISEPLLEDGVVYFLTGSNSFYALDAATGKQLWLYTRQDPNPLSVRGGSKPTYHNGTLYLGFSDGYFVSLIAKSGQLKWEKQLNRNKKFRDLDSNPIIDGDYVYTGGFDDKVYCLRAATGDIVWSTESGTYGGFLTVKDKLIVATTQSELLALDKTTGKTLWSYQLKEGISTSASLYRGLVVVGESQGSVQFLDSGTGKRVGSFDPGKGILSPVTVDEKNNHVFFVSGEANIYALEIGFKYPPAIPYLR